MVFSWLHLVIACFFLAGVLMAAGPLLGAYFLASRAKEGDLVAPVRLASLCPGPKVKNVLAVLAAVNTAISLYYYLNIVRHAYTLDEPGRPPVEPVQTIYANAWGLVLAGLVLTLGMIPGPVLDIAAAAGSRLASP